ncbi:aldehyde reductase [Streptomyces sp. KK5PA1]|uniref:Aldehyde reductase n=2 Tax=Actinacidiphila acididurans TaxID=2784346 RepID=A0ABS2TIS5_9ACTN|nr:aldehyde reductase [Actinacidiphila acididurans]
MSGETVLVTGGTGFLATRCMAQALEAGFRVRTTVRAPGREERVRAELRAAGAPAEAVASIGFTLADLTADEGWAQAVAGCDYVLHTASPFPPAAPRSEDELIVPAREGTLRVLRAARDAGVQRIVVTSSFAAIGYGHPPTPRPFTEDDWTDVRGPGVNPYIKSKALAELAAWDFAGSEPGAPELAVVNPVGIFGPVLGPDHSSSIAMVGRLLDGSIRAVPNLWFAVVDVRDAADLHLRAMTRPEAAGRRFIAAAGDAVSYHRIAMILRERLGDAAAKAPTRTMPDWAVRIGARFVPDLRAVTRNVGVVRHLTAERARTELAWTPRSTEDTVAATGRSLVDLDLLGERSAKE